ncbi:hypothetical protein MP228_011325 [Amoeboaphelidium protococcarum]|nr:hypothetical protein MP228_011325 [Amoeboaphelidium protococcarum]
MGVIIICLLACGEDYRVSFFESCAVVEPTPLTSIQAYSTDAFTFEKEQQGRKKREDDASLQKQARSGSLRNIVP